jgi:hypothetical protein
MMSVWHRLFWKSLWFALLRSREDKRARAAVFGILLLLAWIAAEAWLVFVVPAREGHGVLQLVFNGFVVATGFIAALLLRRSNRKQDELLNFSITGRNPRQLPEDVLPEVRRYLGVTRQVQNTLLRQMPLGEIGTRRDFFGYRGGWILDGGPADGGHHLV